MTTSNQALFSRPVLAALMVLITLLVWVLNATAPTPRYAQPTVTQWTTQSMIPVTWLDQEIWQGTNKLEIRLRFNHGRADDLNQGLTDALFALLLLDTLPLSTASINKRLESTTATVDFHVSEDDSELAITLNSDQPFLDSSLAIITSWLASPVFKERTFARWQQSDSSYYLSPKAQLSQHLYPTVDNSPLDSVMEEYSLSLENVKQHYQSLKHKIDKITLVGHIAKPDEFKQHLDTLSENFKATESDKNIHSAAQIALHTQEGSLLKQSHGAFAIKELETVNDWISLQIWLHHLLIQINEHPATEYSQLHLERSHLRQWVWWSTQHKTPQESDRAIVQDSYAARELLEMSLTSMTNDQFESALTALQEKIAQLSLSPTWWARIASQETPTTQPLDLTTWLESYATNFESINYQEYKDSLQRIVLLNSYQEIQVRE